MVRNVARSSTFPSRVRQNLPHKVVFVNMHKGYNS
jgi:hypothetical protein